MKSSTPASPATKFARYATASAAALGAAAAHAQFTGAYSLTSPSPAAGDYTSIADGATFGAWTVSVTNGGGTNDLNTTSADGSNFVSFNSFDDQISGLQQFTLLTTAGVASDVMVSFHWSASLNFTLATPSVVDFSYKDGTGFHTLHSGAGYMSGNATFLVTTGNQFGFQLSANYAGGIAPGGYVSISNFSVITAVPEPGASGLLMGCASVGFVALLGVREMRRRAAAKPAA